MGPKKTVTVTEALTRNLAPLLEMKVNQDGIPTALEPGDILSFLHEREQYNAQRTDVMERALILLCMSGDVRDYLAQYESLLTVNHTENDEVQEWELLSYDHLSTTGGTRTRRRNVRNAWTGMRRSLTRYARSSACQWCGTATSRSRKRWRGS